MRPRSLEEFVGQEHLVGERGPLRRSLSRGHLTSLIPWRPPCTGKTTLARLLAAAIGAEMIAISAVSAGVAEVRGAINEAQERLAMNGQRTILLIWKVHRFNKSQQDALPLRRGRHDHRDCNYNREPIFRGERMGIGRRGSLRDPPLDCELDCRVSCGNAIVGATTGERMRGRHGPRRT
jgi:hypothetical protein